MVIFRLVDLVKAVNSWVRSATGNVFQRIEVHLVIQMYFSLERAETSVETFVLIIRRHLGELLTLAQALGRKVYTKNHIDLHVLFDLVHMGPEHASREKKFTMVIFFIFLQINIYIKGFQKMKIRP